MMEGNIEDRLNKIIADNKELKKQLDYDAMMYGQTIVRMNNGIAWRIDPMSEEGRRIMEEGNKPVKLPCPHCGSDEHLSFNYKMYNGHGDCGYDNARIVCESPECKSTYGYGEPTKEDELKAWERWNKRA